MGVVIYALDAFTNGYEAALAFIRRQAWKEEDCEIVFCRTHGRLLKQLSEGPAYAVVPVFNSIAGEVTEVTKIIAELKAKGYEILVKDQIDLQINHCLMAPKSICNSADLQEVMSHEKAIQQCGKYLDRIGILSEHRSKCDSTGNAAKVVSRLGPEAKIGAIAPRAAAEEYGLKILAENIQDRPDNKTTFLLLENKSEVKRVVVGIIGINGKFGRMLKNFFEQIGCSVIGSDKNVPSGLSNALVVERSDVIIFSVPINDAPSIIRSVLPGVKCGQLLMDVTSVKQPSVEAMLEGNAQVVGLHPMFRPEVSFDGQTVVVCPARLTMPNWKKWVVNMLAATHAKIKWSTPAEHDRYMTTVQVVPHLGNLVSALLITEAGTSVAESMEFTSPFYRIMLSQMGRLVSQNPGMYTSILMENPETLNVLEERIKIEQRLIEMIRTQDRNGFEQLFVQARKHFGEDVVNVANELFMRLIGVLNTIYGRNSVILEFTKADSNPGLLERVLEVFKKRQINLTGISSVFLDGKLQFPMSFEQSKSSDEVRRALEEIENWKDLKVKVIS